MPRTAATIFGMALATAAIGFNMSRYPILGRILEPPNAEQPAAVAQSPPAEETIAEPAGAPADEPAEVAAERRGLDNPDAPIMAEPAARIADEKNDLPPTPANAPLSSEPEKPMVEVNMASGRAADNPAVRRLPPVAADDAAMRVHGISGGRVPVYPSTGR